MKNKTTMPFLQKIVLVTILSFFSLSGQLKSQIGYDPSFDGDGLFTYNEVGTNEHIVSVLEQPDGKVVIVGETNYDPDEANNSRIFLIWLKADGTYDANGKKYIDTPAKGDVPAAATLQADGKILIAGYQGSYEGTVYRLNTNGTLDNTFGSGGKAVIASESVYEFENIKVQSNGKIVVSGGGFIDSRFCYLIARFNTNGQLDNTFNPAGTPGYIKFRTSTQNTREDSNAGLGLAIQPDGKIVSCGYNEIEDGTVIRLTANGTLDPTFAVGGIKYIDFTREMFLYSIVIDCDGKIVVGGYYDYSSSLNKAMIMRFLPNGNFDNSFGSSGFEWYGNDFGFGYVVALQCDCKYLIGGGRYLARVQPNGALDPSFANNGHFNVNINYSPWATTLTLGASKIYMAGYSVPQSGSADQQALALRLNNDINCGSTPTESPDIMALKLYPNPVNNYLTIETDEDSKIESITLTDHTGRQIFVKDQFFPNGSTLQCDMTTLPAGVYYLAVSTKNGRLVRPVIKL